MGAAAAGKGASRFKAIFALRKLQKLERGAKTRFAALAAGFPKKPGGQT